MGGVAGVGSNHKKANDYVNTFQNPFGERLKYFSSVNQRSAPEDPNAPRSMIQGGPPRPPSTPLTYKEAQEALDQFNQEWTAFDQGSQEYKKMGGGFEKVVNQAYDPNKDFMKTVMGVRAGLEADVARLKGTEAPKDTTESTPPLLDPKASVDQARAAADMARRRAKAGSGYAGTIVGGASASPILRRPPVMGY